MAEASPPLVLPTTDVICAVPQAVLPGGDTGVVTDYGSGFFGGTDYGLVACSTLATVKPGCPPTMTGQISGAGNRIPLQIEISGPGGTAQESAILDTGGVDEYLAQSDLQAAGLTPTGTATSSVGGWTGTVDIYALPAADLLVLDNGTYVPLTTGTLTVYGLPAAATADGVPYLIGPNVLQNGAQLSTNGSTWTLQPACPS